MNDNHLQILDSCSAWHTAYQIQRDTVFCFHRLCADALGTACTIRPVNDKSLEMKRNLFSTLFVMATNSLGLAEEKVRFYAVVNHCLRALVTGCDNILDNEYKEVIPFDLSGEGFKFRSVLHIMTADAVLMQLVTEEIAAGRLTPEQAARLSHAVLAVLIPSGVEEHEEESHLLDREVMLPSQVIDVVLYRKTGLLFQAPLKLIEQMGDASAENVFKPAEALTDFGIGCQILDESMDVAEDVQQGRPNLVVSIAYHGEDVEERSIVRRLTPGETLSESHAADIAAHLPHAIEECRLIAVNYFIHAYRAFAEAVPEFTPDAAFALATLVQKAILKDSYAPLISLSR